MNAVRAEGEVYPSGGDLEVTSVDVASVALNQLAPPVGTVFGTEVKEVNVLEDPVGFFKSRFEPGVRVCGGDRGALAILSCAGQRCCNLLLLQVISLYLTSSS
jgi:hypothetical protein